MKEVDPEYCIRRGKGRLPRLKNGPQKSLSLIAGTSPWDQRSGKRRILRYAIQMKPSANFGSRVLTSDTDIAPNLYAVARLGISSDRVLMHSESHYTCGFKDRFDYTTPKFPGKLYDLYCLVSLNRVPGTRNKRNNQVIIQYLAFEHSGLGGYKTCANLARTPHYLSCQCLSIFPPPN